MSHLNNNNKKNGIKYSEISYLILHADLVINSFSQFKNYTRNFQLTPVLFFISDEIDHVPKAFVPAFSKSIFDLYIKSLVLTCAGPLCPRYQSGRRKAEDLSPLSVFVQQKWKKSKE